MVGEMSSIKVSRFTSAKSFAEEGLRILRRVEEDGRLFDEQAIRSASSQLGQAYKELEQLIGMLEVK